MNRIILFMRCVVAIAAIFVFVACQTLPKQEVTPNLDEKYSEITIVNDDYPRTNDALYKLTDGAGGEISAGTAEFDEFGGRAEYSIDVPYENYESFIESVNKEFGIEALERETKTGVSVAAQYADISREIENKTAALGDVQKYAEVKSSDPAALEFERKKLEKDIARLRSKRIETLARMDRGRVVVKWMSREAAKPPEDYPMPFDAPIPGLPMRELNFDAPGASGEFNFGENVEVNLNMPRAEDVNLTATVDYDSEKVTLKAVPPGVRDTVVLNHMCQSVIVSGDVIPEVKLAGSLATEQIVITPMVNETCGKIGYEIRAGTLERGCDKGESKRIFNMLAKCRGEKPKPAVKQVRKAKLPAKVKTEPKRAPNRRRISPKEKPEDVQPLRKRPASRKAGSKTDAKLKREIIDYIKRLP